MSVMYGSEGVNFKQMLHGALSCIIATISSIIWKAEGSADRIGMGWTGAAKSVGFANMHN